MSFDYARWDGFCRKVCFDADRKIKRKNIIPVDTGNLKHNATYCAPKPALIGCSAYSIKLDGYVAPYIVYNEEGTKPHDIEGAFGYPSPFGIGGRFDGMFHPGSYKNKSFISNRMVREVYLTAIGELRKRRITIVKG